MNKLYCYEIWIQGKDGFSQYFATDVELDFESAICEFAIKHNLIDSKDVKHDLGYAQNVDDDKQKVSFALENTIKMETQEIRK